MRKRIIIDIIYQLREEEYVFTCCGCVFVNQVRWVYIYT